jgi:glycosyltransferase involved in cell wall biosynthesis
LKLSVLIPVFDERDTIARVVTAVLAADLGPGITDREVIVIDDGSRDGTRDVLRRYLVENASNASKVRVVSHERNQGKGAAIRTGISGAQGDIVVVQDADLEYDPADLARLLAPIVQGRADVVFGTRFAGGESHRVLYFWHSVANRFLTLCSNALTNLNLTDMEVGYKAVRRDVLAKIKLEEDRFGFEPELTAKLARLGCRVYEVGISYNGRTYAEGKKIGWRDGVHALWCIIKYNLLA